MEDTELEESLVMILFVIRGGKRMIEKKTRPDETETK